MLVEIIRELIKCEEYINRHNENVLTFAKRVETQRSKTVVPSSLHEAKKLMQLHKRISSTQTKDPQQIH